MPRNGISLTEDHLQSTIEYPPLTYDGGTIQSASRADSEPFRAAMSEGSRSNNNQRISVEAPWTEDGDTNAANLILAALSNWCDNVEDQEIVINYVSARVRQKVEIARRRLDEYRR